MQDGMSEKEKALIEAARRDLEKMRARPAETISSPPAPSPARPVIAPQLNSVPAKRPDVPASKHEIVLDGTPRDAIAMRIALLMEAEREEKARRLKSHRRWKVGAIGAFVVLSGWWALTIISHLRH